MNLPDLSKEPLIAVDIETYDPSIGQGLGSGARRGGYILGVGIATPGKQFYFPLNHSPIEDELFEGEQFQNADKKKFFKWLESLRSVPAVGANVLYDLDYLQYNGYIPDDPHDIQIAGPLIDENQKSYSLDALAQDWLGEKKSTKEIDAWCKSRKLKGKSQQYLKDLPVSLVGGYCKEDCRQTIEIFQMQRSEIDKQELNRVYDLERSLIPCLLKMKRLGVRIDGNKFNKIKDQSIIKREEIKKDLKDNFGMSFNENDTITNAAIKKVFDKLGYSYIMTDKDNACFDKSELLKNGKELGKKIIEYRHACKIVGTYIEGFEPHIVNGRIHTEFNPLRISKSNGDEYGTRIGRFSSTAPALQVIPREGTEDDENIGGLIRSIFLPEEDHYWAKLDYSKMEMVIGIHFARGRGAEEFREKLRQNPDLLIYEYIASLVLQCSIEEAKPHKQKFKSLTLGKMYAMAADKLGRQLGLITLPVVDGVVRSYWDHVFKLMKEKVPWETCLEKGWEIFDIGPEYAYLDQYMKAWRESNKMDRALPWIKETVQACQEVAERKGFVRTILGRRRRFPDQKDAYKAFQSVDSGTGADIMKSAMVKAFKDGIFDVIPCHLTEHDELDVSVPHTEAGAEALAELKNIMETVITLRVPLRVEVKTGKNWGELKK